MVKNLIQILFGTCKMEDKKIKDTLMIVYQDLMKAAVDREDYELAGKYKKWIENLKKSDE